MIPYISKVVFSEPQGHPNSTVQLGVSLLYLCLFVYFSSVGSVGEFLFIPFLIVGTALSGIADSMPESRRQAAGVLRLTALVVLVSMIVITIVTPELVMD
jgi:hypothetical protein